jgi:anti-sigma factor RsiW
MANCQEFKQWLNNQDSADEKAFRQVEDHIQHCQTCEKLYQTDMALDTMLKKGMQAVEPPPGLIGRARHKIKSQSRPRPFKFLKVSWKTAVPALSMAALVLVMLLLNPFSGHLQTVDEVVANSIANHLDTNMKMDFRAEEVSDADQWFSQRLGYRVQLPDLKKLGLSLLGGRKCALGKIDAALLFCNLKGKHASLFVINQIDVGVRFDNERKYIVEEGDHKVTLWKESGMVYAMVV